MRVRHLHRRTRPFRYLGFWMLGAAAVPLVWRLADGHPRRLGQVLATVAFCLVWPWAVDVWRRRGPPDEAARFEVLSYVAECGVVALVFAWASVPSLVGFAAGLCLLAGATALVGWRLLLPSAAACMLCAAAGASLAPALTARSTTATDVLALTLVLGFSLALGDLSCRQARRLAGHRRSLAEKSAALERINDRMQRYLPPSLRDRVARAPEEPCRWERRWLTVAFVDLVGFTELSERLEAELLAGVVDEYLGALIPAAETRGGEVSKLMGDGVLVVFGLRHGGDRSVPVQAAVALCRELPELLERLAGRWRARGELVALEMRAGIASGFCTLGDRGGAGRLDFTLIGPPVNLASRLQAHAPVNGALLDEVSAVLAQGPEALAAPRTLEVKGLGATTAFRLDDMCPLPVVDERPGIDRLPAS